MTRTVIDTNVVVSGILNRAGVPAGVLKAARLRYELGWSPAIAVECQRILDLPRVLKRLKGRETQARQVLAVGNFAGVMVVSAAESLATIGEP